MKSWDLTRHAKRWKQSWLKRQNKVLSRIGSQWRRCWDADYDPMSARWQAGACFPTRTLAMRDWSVVNRWEAIERCSSPRDDEKLIKEWMRTIRGYTMVTYDGQLSLALQVRYCEENQIPGVYVETGCHLGGASALMARASRHYGPRQRPVHAFDSFQGLPQPDAARDTDSWIAEQWEIPPEQHQGKMVPTGSLAGASEEDVRYVFGLLGNSLAELHTHKGWFCDTLPVVAPSLDQIAILRLDGDLYSSTGDALVHLYPKVVAGGFVVIDDYDVTGARDAVTDYLKRLPRPPFICRADGAVAYFIKQTDEARSAS